MAEITAAVVKDLREKTGAGMMDCKRALAESGLVGALAERREGAIVEVNCETDFVARNEAFQDFVKAVTGLALARGDDIERLKAAPFPGTGRTVAEELTHLIATIGENMTLRRAKRIVVSSGVVMPYVHSALAPGIGKIGALVALESGADAGALQTLGRELAMHVAAANPAYLDTASVDQATLEREREILRDRARQAGKADAIIDKIVEGQLRKFYEENVLLEQVHVRDGESRIGKVVEAGAKSAGVPIRLAGYARFKVGEGIEKG
jgi:elongation factor Ts